MSDRMWVTSCESVVEVLSEASSRLLCESVVVVSVSLWLSDLPDR